ncbi:MAG: dienelactone hydrolase [Rhodobacterales bacterium]|nr:dienelactone hydrolase [Rhodobacterales bacterium]
MTPETRNRIDLVRPDAPELVAFGPHCIGVRTITVINPGQPDVVRATETEVPVYDRALKVEIWYPAADDTVPGGTYNTVLRDGVTPAVLSGRAAQDAAVRTGGRFPLVIISHGHPGNRFLLSPYAENLASKGYVVASIDHRDSTYDDLGAFGATLVHRPWDLKAVLDQLAGRGDDLGAVTDTSRTAVIGYSMGGYGALIFSGGGLTATSPDREFAPPQRLLARNVAGTETLAQLLDDRMTAAVTFGPWGRNADLWDAAGLSQIAKPQLIIAGSQDDVSDYGAIRKIFTETKGTTRHLLTFEAANHNAGAPMPAPDESWAISPKLGHAPFFHYADPIWDTVRMNNISAHFITAFLGQHLKGDAGMAAFLDLAPNAADGVSLRDETGARLPGDTYWAGFAPRTAAGLRFETLTKGN